MKWISEAERLPPIGQKVLLAHPAQGREHWDIQTAQLLVQYEGVAPAPVKQGDQWPTSYWWSAGPNGQSSTYLVTGNSWWALLNTISLPPGAEHRQDREYWYVAQPESVWVGQRERGAR